MTTTPTSTTNAAAPAPTTPTIIYSNNARFPLGQIVATPGALELLQETGFSAAALISRHVQGDGGEPHRLGPSPRKMASASRCTGCTRLRSGMPKKFVCWPLYGCN